MPPRKRAAKTEVPPINFDKIAEETDMPRGRFGRTAVEETPEAQVSESYPVEDVQVTEPEQVDTTTEEKGTEEVTAVAEAPTTEQTENTQETAEQAAERKRAPRPAINVGHVVVRKSERTDFTTRATPTESNPVFLAVKNAGLDEATDILVENDAKKIQGAISILRRAGAKLGVGMHIAPKGAEGYPTEEVEGTTYAVLTFKTSAERQVRGKKEEGTTEVAASE